MESSLKKANNVREKWHKEIDFLIGLLGGTIGLGNVWRFPYLCYRNGGGAFLIPYFFFLFTMCLPMFFLEATLGQLTSQGILGAWSVVPLMKGIGFSTYIVIFNSATYYMIILAWALRYIVASFSSTLPWSTCGNAWNTDDCFVFIGRTSENTEWSETVTENSTRISSVTEYWQRKILRLSKGIDHIGNIQWELLLCLAASWLIIYFSVWKGIKWTSKIMYFTASFPLVMLVILLIRGVTLDGASDGISYYLKPNTTKLREPQVWADAATQVFYSYSICFGFSITLGSYNSYHHNTLRDTGLLALFNSGTSFVSGFAVFSILGHMAKVQNIDIDTVADSGPGLVFEAYPNAIALLPLSQLWGVLFFLMIFFLGVDTQFADMEILIAGITDLNPSFFNRPWRREALVAIIVFMHFIIGLSMISQGGIYVFNIYDNYAVAGWCLFLIGFFECLTIGWLFGAERYWKHVCHMLTFDPHLRLWFKGAIKFVVPLTVTILAINNLVQYKPLTYNRSYSYPVWSQCIAWLIILFTLSWIPGVMIFQICRNRGTLRQRWKKVTALPKSFEKLQMSFLHETETNEHETEMKEKFFDEAKDNDGSH